jgi:hypothetical protein
VSDFIVQALNRVRNLLLNFVYLPLHWPTYRTGHSRNVRGEVCETETDTEGIPVVVLQTKLLLHSRHFLLPSDSNFSLNTHTLVLCTIPFNVFRLLFVSLFRTVLSCFLLFSFIYAWGHLSSFLYL